MPVVQQVIRMKRELKIDCPWCGKWMVIPTSEVKKIVKRFR